LHFGNISLLAFKDDFSKFHFAAADLEKKTPIYERSVWSRFTGGAHITGTALRKVVFTASAFYQGGKFREGTSLDEYLLSASAMYSAGRKFTVGPGVDITSGNNGADPAKKYQRFDPLYGTPHKFWGYMDYFYVADGFGANGLVDACLKTKYKAKDNLTLSLDVHQFSLPNAVTNESGVLLEKTLGQELDFVLSYGLTKVVNIEGGYSAMFGTATLTSSKVKNVNNADGTSHWAYLMISIKPDFKSVDK
jgi:hypothetical protein